MTTACTSYTRAARLRKTAWPRTERARSHARLARATIRKPRLLAHSSLKSSCRQYDWFMPRLTDIWCMKLLVCTWIWSVQYTHLGYRTCATWHINRIQYSFEFDSFEPRYTLLSFTQSLGYYLLIKAWVLRLGSQEARSGSPEFPQGVPRAPRSLRPFLS